MHFISLFKIHSLILNLDSTNLEIFLENLYDNVIIIIYIIYLISSDTKNLRIKMSYTREKEKMQKDLLQIFAKPLKT